MKMVGILTGEFEGNKWSKLIFTEAMPDRPGCYGLNAVISKARYDYVSKELLPVAGLYLNQEVEVYYDRFGKIQNVRLVDNNDCDPDRR